MSDHEIRIALVLNGGVSLAVWMGGVTHELDLIRRASGGATMPAAQPYDEELANRWKELCRRGDEQRRVVIDVIAGTSAGGVNGSLLATAIANGASVDPEDYADDSGPWLRREWMKLGSLEVGKLIPAAGTRANSVLDGRYFLHELDRLMRGVAIGKPSASEPVTLFVTASGLGIQQFVAQDAAGQRFTVPDHRYLYAFTSERSVRYDGSTRGFSILEQNGLRDAKLLARAARASASFPVAFGPVLETPQMGSGQRIHPSYVATGAWLIDGGVLDNAPFAPVLDMVARRPVSGRATRYVMYVVPSAGIGTAGTQLPYTEEPSWRVAALSAVKFPREVDFRADVEELERLLLEADASWSDNQRLFDRCLKQEAERARLRSAAKLLQPTYVRGRAAGGIWEAVTIASHDSATALDAASALSEAEIDQVLATNHPWVPYQDGATAPLRDDRDGNPCWDWGTGAAERVVRLVLRSLRAQIDATPPRDRADLERRLKAASDSMLRVQAVRDALAADLAVADLDLQRYGGAVAVAAALTDIFESLQVRRTLGDEIASLMKLVGADPIETALEVEIVSRCTSARTPQQRSAPFQFLRLGPDIGLAVLDDLPEGSIANDLRDRILYGSQVGHFGAFGAADWRRWDWLMGRLHCVAHLGAMLGADHDWIRETQRQVLQSEGWNLQMVADRVVRLARDFPADAGLGALAKMRDELNHTQEGRSIARGIFDRLVDVSGGLGPQAGAWARAMAGRSNRPGSWLFQTVRWVTEPARFALWYRLVQGVSLKQARRPLIFQRWLPVAVFAVAVGLVVIAAGMDQTVVRIIAAVLAGVVLAISTALFVGTWYVRRQRRRLRRWVEERMPPISPASRSR